LIDYTYQTPYHNDEFEDEDGSLTKEYVGMSSKLEKYWTKLRPDRNN